MGIILEKIPLFIPSLPKYGDLEKYIRRIDENHHYTNFGALEREVRVRLGEYLGLPVDQIVTCSNATLGIQGAIQTSDAQGLWELPAWTFTATPAALAISGHHGEFADVGGDWRVRPTKQQSNLIDVLPFGQGIGLIDKYELNKVSCVLLDAAASFDSLKSVRLPSTIPTAGVLSFHATKVMTAGEGGLFFTNSVDWASRFKSWTTFGMRGSRTSNFVGTNAKMSEYHAAVLLASLDAWPQDRAKWLSQRHRAQSITRTYGFNFEPIGSEDIAAPYWIVSHKDENRINKLNRHFNNLDIETRKWWESGCHAMPAYGFMSSNAVSNTDTIAATSIGLPLWKEMSEAVWQRLEFAFESFD